MLIGYLSYVLIGWIVLSWPVAHRGEPIGALDNLFIATSAVSTTGLVTVSVADGYSAFGQGVILLLIQIGGIGYMTFSSFLILARHNKLSADRTTIMRQVFTLPEGFRLDVFVRGVVMFTFVIELIGAAVLYTLFVAAGDPQPAWSAVFHSVSAFCTAGFSLYNSSFEAHAGNFWINATIAALSYLGAIGFIVCLDAWRLVAGVSRGMTLTSKIILWTTFWISLLGSAMIFLTEPTIQHMPVDQRLMASVFQCMTAITTVGFNTVSIGAMSKATLLLIITMMIIGASPAGTGGGLKSTTFSAVIGVMRSAVRGEREVRYWGRPIPFDRVWTAFANLGFYLLALLVGVYLLEMTESSPFEDNMFEAASALGTVGLSTGITPGLSHMGKLIIIALMFCGRVSPLTFGVAILFRKTNGDKGNADLAV